MANLGFIGLGAMGGNIAARLLDSGHQVTGYNRTRAKAQWLVDRGMKWANSPRDVATAADVIFTMVTNGEALTSVAAGDSGLLAGLSGGKYCVDMSTVGPDISRRLASHVRERGADMIDAPVSGSVLTLQQGKLSIMVGGRQETFETLKPVLQDIGPKVTYVGANGLALALKIALNLQLAVQMLAFSEGVLLAEKSGISRDTAVDVMLHSAVASPMLQYRGTFRPQTTRAGVVRRQHDAERRASGNGVGEEAQRSGPDHRSEQRVFDGGTRNGMGEVGLRNCF